MRIAFAHRAASTGDIVVIAISGCTGNVEACIGVFELMLMIFT